METTDETPSIQSIIEAIERFKDIMSSSLREQLENLKVDHQRLLDFRMRGIKDEQREEIYENLRQRAFTLLSNCHMDQACAMPGFKEARDLTRKSPYAPIGMDYIRQTEENFVRGLATLSSTTGDQRETDCLRLHERHFSDLELIFSCLLTSYQWTRNEAKEFLDFLLSPSCDPVDAQVMVSAITLNVMRQFDSAKAWLLARIYQEAKEEHLRQRALVGWAFTLPAYHYVASEEYDTLCDELLEQAEVREDLLTLQKQYLLCLDTEKDTKKLENQIFPKILKNAPYEFTSNGIKEKPRDKTEEILHPQDEEMKMKELEECMEMIQKMKETGTDVYYGSFSKLKRHPFFSRLVNWFMPFSKEHPMISKAAKSLEASHLLEVLSQEANLCDSDRYTLVTMASSFLGFLPEEARGQALGGQIPVMMNGPEDKTPAHIRQLYLQDLFRFARVCPLAKYFVNPFDELRMTYPMLFFDGVDENSCSDEKSDIAMFLFAQKKYRDFRRMTLAMEGVNTVEYHLMLATYFMRLWDEDLDPDEEREKTDSMLRQAQEKGDLLEQVYTGYGDDIERAADMCYEQIYAALDLDKDNVQALCVLASFLGSEEKWDEVVKVCERVYRLRPDNKRVISDLALALMKNGQEEDAANYIYRLSLELPDNPDVMRLQAWLQLSRKQPEKALALYRKLMDNKGKTIPDDVLNAGYCVWMSEDWQEATRLFSEYVKRCEGGIESLLANFESDRKILEMNGINAIDRYIMEDVMRKRTGEATN